MSFLKSNALFCIFLCFLISSSFAQDTKVSSVSDLAENSSFSSPLPTLQNTEELKGDDEAQGRADVRSSLVKETAVKEESKAVTGGGGGKGDKVAEDNDDIGSFRASFLDTLMDMLSFFDFIDEFYGEGEEDFDDFEEAGNARKNEEKVDGSKSEEFDEKELEEMLDAFFGLAAPDSSSSSSSFFSSFFPFSSSAALPSMSNVTDYLSDLFNWSSVPYFFDAMFAPLVGMLYRGDSLLGRITTIVDENEKLCMVNVDMANLPSTSIMQVEVENDGTVMVYFSNGQVMSIAGESIIPPPLTSSSSNTSDSFSHSNLRGKDSDDKQENEVVKKEAKKDDEDDDIYDEEVVQNDEKNDYLSFLLSSAFSGISISTPDIVSTVYSTSTFLLDKRCDASSDDAKATIDDDILVMKFPLKACAFKKNDKGEDECTQEPEEENLLQNDEVTDKTNADEKVKQNNDEQKKEKEGKQRSNDDDVETILLKQIEEDEKYKKGFDEIMKKREELSKAGPVPDPLYMNKSEVAKKKHIVPLVKLEEF